jgi:hypothetical protein
MGGHLDYVLCRARPLDFWVGLAPLASAKSKRRAGPGAGCGAQGLGPGAGPLAHPRPPRALCASPSPFLG